MGRVSQCTYMRRVWHALVTVARGGLYAHAPCTSPPPVRGCRCCRRMMKQLTVYGPLRIESRTLTMWRPRGIGCQTGRLS
jgi:hypothetical protein